MLSRLGRAAIVIVAIALAACTEGEPASAHSPTVLPPTSHLTALSLARTSATPTPTAPAANFDSFRSDIEFAMKERYRPDEPIEIRIRNQSPSATYYYLSAFPACFNLKFFDNSAESRPYPYETPGQPPSLLLPGQFIVPEGTHCDLGGERPLLPGEEVVLLTWSQGMCTKDLFGCKESVPVDPGDYRIVGEFARVSGGISPMSSRDRRGEDIAVAEWRFVIESQR